MNAKVHHYVPRFLLAGFSADPHADNPPLWRLDRRTGSVSRSSARNEAAVSRYNELRNVQDLPSDFVERTLALIEGRAASLVGALIDGHALANDERLDMALFVYVQHYRTPRGREWLAESLEQLHTLGLQYFVLDPRQLQAHFGSIGETISLEEAEARGREYAHDLETGKVVVKVQHDHGVAGMFVHMKDIVPAIAGEMSWEVLHSDEAAFVTCDHPVLIHDSEANPRRGVSWLSSPKVRASLSLDRRSCLVLRPGEQKLSHRRAEYEEILDLNLATYASAEWSVYGPSHHLLQSLRTEARKRRIRVAQLRPKPPLLHIEEYTEGQEAPDRIRRLAPKGTVRRRQTWPRWD